MNNYSVFKHEGVIKRAILELKYNFSFDLSTELADLVYRKVKNYYVFKNKNTVLVPVPLSKYREQWRGFNQTEALGKGVPIVALRVGTIS